jgi:hypothetical protein
MFAGCRALSHEAFVLSPMKGIYDQINSSLHTFHLVKDFNLRSWVPGEDASTRGTMSRNDIPDNDSVIPMVFSATASAILNISRCNHRVIQD